MREGDKETRREVKPVMRGGGKGEMEGSLVGRRAQSKSTLESQRDDCKRCLAPEEMAAASRAAWDGAKRDGTKRDGAKRDGAKWDRAKWDRAKWDRRYAGQS